MSRPPQTTIGLGLRFALLLTTAAAWAACFDGSGADGFPCERDEDCGPSLLCEDGCCGGTCKFEDAGGPGSGSSSGTTTTTTTTTTSGSSTTVTDTDPQSTTEPTSTTTGPVGCGDGEVGSDEECDLGDANGPNASCTPQCREAECGDGLTWDSEGGQEECDDGEDNGADPYSGCSSECRAPFFHWDQSMTPQVTGTLWCTDGGCERTADVTSGWVSPTAGEPWTTGSDRTDIGTAVLASASFEIPAGGGVWLQFQHDVAFEVCDPGVEGEEQRDGGRVFIRRQDGSLVQVFPERGANPLDCPPTCGGNAVLNPQCGPAPLGDLGPPVVVPTDGFETVEFELNVDPGQVQILFEAGWDCSTCTGTAPVDEWRLRSVSIAYFPPPK